MDQNAKTEFGTIKIHKNVIASIAENTIKDIPGAIGIAGNLKTKLLKLLKRDPGVPSISIEFDKNGEAYIDIPLVVSFGYNLPEVASHVQDSVKSAIENATNIVIKEINVNVKQIERSKGGENENL